MLDVVQQSGMYRLTWNEWRLRFDWQADRWQHALWRDESGQWQVCLQSIEGTDNQIWPESPAFQHAFLQPINADVAEIQLLGQAGKNHYSGAVRFDSIQQLIDFDLAIQIQNQPPEPWVLSTYEIPRPWNREGLESRLKLDVQSVTGQPAVAAEWQTIVRSSGTRKRSDDSPATSAPTDNSALVLKLLVANESNIRLDKQRATVRWKYQWRL